MIAVAQKARDSRRWIDHDPVVTSFRNALGQDPIVSVGNTQSEGDKTHKTANARTIYGVDGTGVKIGVLPAVIAGLPTTQSTGDLPKGSAMTVLPGHAGSGNEGTAMLEIINDIAPGAQLYFATGGPSTVAFADNIKALRAVGCDIIVDDISVADESPFQDAQTYMSTTSGGSVAQAVKDVTAGNGALFTTYR